MVKSPAKRHDATATFANANRTKMAELFLHIVSEDNQEFGQEIGDFTKKIYASWSEDKDQDFTKMNDALFDEFLEFSPKKQAQISESYAKLTNLMRLMRKKSSI